MPTYDYDIGIIGGSAGPIGVEMAQEAGIGYKVFGEEFKDSDRSVAEGVPILKIKETAACNSQ